jgi:hypothetical protein
MVGSNVKQHLENNEREKAYLEKLGIGYDDEEVEAFIEEQLLGLSHPEAILKLQELGDVTVDPKTCKKSWCEIHVSNFLETGAGYPFTILYEDGRVVSVEIYRSNSQKEHSCERYRS